MSEPIGVLVEQGKKRAVASAFDWPGWGRSAKSEPDALVVLGAYRPRYAKVAELAGLGDAFAAAGALAVVERLVGTGMGDFYGVSGTTAAPEYEQMSEDECDRKGRGGHLPGRMAGSERPARPPRRLQCGDPGAQRRLGGVVRCSGGGAAYDHLRAARG